MNPKPFGLAVKVLILDDQQRLLLLRRSDACRNFKFQWECPGGKVEEGEPFDLAAVREVAEETSLAVTLTHVAGATEFELPDLHVAVLWLEGAFAGGEVKLSEEHDAFGWAPLDQLNAWDLTTAGRDFLLDYAGKKGGRL